MLVIHGSQYKNALPFAFVNARLHRHILLRVRVVGILIGKLIHVVKEYDHRRFFLCLFKGCLDLIDKVAVRLVLAESKHLAARLGDETICHQRLTETGLPIQKQSARHGDPQLHIFLRILDNVRKADQFHLYIVISDDLVKRFHDNPPVP